MRIKVEKLGLNIDKAQLMAKHNKKCHIFNVNVGMEFECEDEVGNVLLGQYSEWLKVLSYGKAEKK